MYIIHSISHIQQESVAGKLDIEVVDRSNISYKAFCLTQHPVQSTYIFYNFGMSGNHGLHTLGKLLNYLQNG
jgi:hypothetical protein